MPVALLGPAYSRQQIETDLAPFADRVDVVRFPSFKETCSNAASLIAAGKVLAWYQGRMEFGPRAHSTAQHL